ncbi:hypothetical protein PR048_006486 [Dryococelus australis]|uniref:Uncharacterized protein n=1 Tax=Dryococelus australis TaxID=614101 RepID=A0ABQ9IB40_9NEOP|nr:hypothetical protein PR048_006486 [Dryococelus australis]
MAGATGAERLARSPATKANRVSGRVTGFSQVGIVLDDAAGRRVFSISRFTRHFIPGPLHTHFNHPHRLLRLRFTAPDVEGGNAWCIKCPRPKPITGPAFCGVKDAPLSLLTAATPGVAVAERLVCSHRREPSSIPGRVTPGFSHAGIVPNDAAGRWVFLGDLPFPQPLHSGDKIDVQHVYTEVTFANGLQFIRDTLDDSGPIGDLFTDSLIGWASLWNGACVRLATVCCGRFPIGCVAEWRLIYQALIGDRCSGISLGSEAIFLAHAAGVGATRLGELWANNRPVRKQASNDVSPGLRKSWLQAGTAANEQKAEANRIQSLAEPLPNFSKRESCRTMPLIGGFSLGCLVSPALAFQRCSILTSFTLIGSQDLVIESRPNLSTQLKTTSRKLTGKGQRPPRFAHAKNGGVTPPGIEPFSPWKERGRGLPDKHKLDNSLLRLTTRVSRGLLNFSTALPQARQCSLFASAAATPNQLVPTGRPTNLCRLLAQPTCADCSPNQLVPTARPTNLCRLLAQLTCADCSPNQLVPTARPTNLCRLLAQPTCADWSPNQLVPTGRPTNLCRLLAQPTCADCSPNQLVPTARSRWSCSWSSSARRGGHANPASFGRLSASRVDLHYHSLIALSTLITTLSQSHSEVTSEIARRGSRMAEPYRLACSAPTRAIRVQSLAGSLQIFAFGNRAEQSRWSAGLLGDLPPPPPPRHGAAPYSPQSPPSVLKASMLRAVQISSIQLCLIAYYALRKILN